VPPAAPSARELDAYREQADRFIAELDEEYYLHYAGLKETFELAPIYERHANLTSLEQAQSIGAAVNGGRSIRELWRFAGEGYMGALTREHAEREARLETELEATVGDRKIPFRMLRPAMANEPDSDKRRELESIRNALTEEHLVPLQLDASRIAHRAAGELGAPSYLELYRRFGFELDALAEQCRSFLETTERLYETAADRLFRARVGIPLAEAKRWDVARVFRAPQWDTAFPSERMLPALEGSLADLGIDLHAQANVHLDVEARPQKTPRAFCAPIEVPDRVMLVIQPIGGLDDWLALFHEAGHAEHFAHTSRDLSVEDRRLGDNAVTEGWAMLIGGLPDDPAWLTRRLDFPRPREFAAESAAGQLIFVRRYCAKLLYEIELHSADDPATMAPRYVELLSEALKIEPSATDWLADVDGGFYASSYLRSWAFEAQLRTFLRERFGNTWFASKDAGSLLRELWSEGQRMTADELLQEVTDAPLELDAVADGIRERLS
jgi:hypothetical protein